MIDLDHGIPNDGVIEKDSRRKKEKEAEAKARQDANEASYLSAPPKTGPVHVPSDRDMHVTLLVLPKLQKYASTTRFGIQSREFGGTTRLHDGRRPVEHDGLSFMILGVRWVENGAGAQSRLRGQARRERMRKAMREVSLTFQGMNGAELEHGKAVVRKLRSELENGVMIKDGEASEKARVTQDDENKENGDVVDKENRPSDAKDAGRDKEDGPVTNGDSGDKMEGVEKTDGKATKAVQA